MIVITAKTKRQHLRYWTGRSWDRLSVAAKPYSSYGRAEAALKRILKSNRWDESQLCDFKVETISIAVAQLGLTC